MAEIKDLIGKTLSKIEIQHNDDEIHFYTQCGKHFKMYHLRSCCESVSIDDICGIPIEDLIGDPILLADERSSEEGHSRSEYDESFTWTFYELATIKGNVTIRWYGTSNGYYSESVDFEEVKGND